MEISGKIFAIKRYAIHDGPNIRTTVFFKGCPLNCRWCHNPEGLDERIDLLTMPERCLGCGTCLKACPTLSLSMGPAGVSRDSDNCISCGLCVAVCPAMAHETTGSAIGIRALLAEIEKDVPFFDQSGGGVTFSGGEPLMQPLFLLSMLEACGLRDIHRTVDTCGFTSTNTLLEIARETDLFLFDIKHMESEIHQRFTGVDNTLILTNIRRLAEQGQALRVRIPLIPGVNDDKRNLRRTGEFVAELPGVEEIDVLPYHRAASAKYRKLSRFYSCPGLDPPGPEEIERAVEVLKSYGLRIRTGG